MNEILERIEKLMNDKEYQERVKKVKQREEETLKQERIYKNLDTLKKIGINYEKWKRKGFDKKYDYQIDMVKSTKKFLDEPTKGIVLTGKTGAGKTHILTLAVIKLIFNGRNVKYFKWLEQGSYFKSIKNEYNYQDKLDTYKYADILYIDDFLKVGKNSQPTDADISLAFEILDCRNENNLPTMISTERSIKEVLEVDEAVGGRMLELCRIRLELKDYKNVKNHRLN